MQGRVVLMSWPHATVSCAHVPPLGAFKSQLAETYILSLLFYIINLSCDLNTYICIYIYMYLFMIIYVHRVNLLCWCLLHVPCIPPSQFDKTVALKSSHLLWSKSPCFPSGNHILEDKIRSKSPCSCLKKNTCPYRKSMKFSNLDHFLGI